MASCMKDGFVEGLVLDGRFESISPLNHGSFGMVFLAKDKTNDNLVAIKCLAKPSTKMASPIDQANDHLLELTCHDRLGYHSNIVNLIHAFETGHHMYLVLEFCSMGDLYEAIRLGRGPLETEHVRGFMLQLVDAVEFMHSKGFYHRDIKPENIFLAHDGSMKLGDFGLSTTETWTYESSVGSDRYMAPEQYDPADVGYCPASADIWAIGICLLNILFSRNPFITPSESDVLYVDFVRDNQSLFDIFPNMSQDTFQVLVHSMAIDPEKRSLPAMREALMGVLSFTTDDEVFDDFCTENREVVPASANRQPLRTPSIQSPPVEQGGAFPWAKALHMSPPITSRNLSAIPDTEIYGEDLFPNSEKHSSSWYSVHAHTPSLASVLDSALGASIKSINLREPKPRHPSRSNPVPFSGSLPVNASKPIPAMSTVFGQKNNVVSQSWSDMWDEDEEEELEDSRRQFNGLNWSSESVNEDITIRGQVLSENTSSANTRTQSQENLNFESLGDGSSENVGSFEDIPNTANKLPTYSPPSKRSILDKWAALGNRRRGLSTNGKDKDENNGNSGDSNIGGLWRRGLDSGFGLKAYSGNVRVRSGASASWGWGDRKNGNRFRDVPSSNNSGRGSRDSRRHPYNQRYSGYNGAKRASEEKKRMSDADLEWVGGWHDLHL